MPNDLNNNVAFQEWKTCRESLAAFDNILIDLRKYGFALITGLVSANGFIFTQANLDTIAIFGIYVALLALIVGLFRVDRVHEVFIRAAVLRAMELEWEIKDDGWEINHNDNAEHSKPGVGLSWEIAYWSEKLKTGTWGHYLYMIFCFAAWVLALAGFIDKTDAKPWDIWILTAATFLVIVASSYIVIHHGEAIELQQEFHLRVRNEGYRSTYRRMEKEKEMKKENDNKNIYNARNVLKICAITIVYGIMGCIAFNYHNLSAKPPFFLSESICAEIVLT